MVSVFFSGIFFLWTEPFFGKRLPAYSGESVQTFTPLVPDHKAGSTPDVNVNGQETGSSGSTQKADNKSVCGQKEPMILLGLGIDKNEQADVIRLIRVDFVEHKILILSIPRDFFVPIPGMSEHNITQDKINAAYGFGEYFNGPGQGVVEFSNTINQNYGIVFDRYVVFHFSNFEQVIDTVGGVDVSLDSPIGSYNISGKRHFDGKTALEFSRLRYMDNDAYRVQRQSEILKSLYAKTIQPENLVKLPTLGIKFISDKTFISDFSLRDISSFTCLANEVNNFSLVFQDIPIEFYQPSITNTGRYVDIPLPQASTFIQDGIINGNY
jgi:LCP family protein required for cell wall assembly